MYDSWNELKILNDSLQKENTAKDREIRRLNKDVQQYEQTIMTLKNKIALSECNTPNVSKKDAEVMVERCAENDCGDWEPVKDYSALLCEETIGYQNRIHKLEADLKTEWRFSQSHREHEKMQRYILRKSTCDSVRALRKMNTAVTEELKAMRRVCALLDEQCQAASARAQFKDDIIREMRRQLKQAKTKLKEVSELKSMKNQKNFMINNREFGLGSSVSMYDSVTIECVRQQPRRKRGDSSADSLKLSLDDSQSIRLDPADDAVLVQHD